MKKNNACIECKNRTQTLSEDSLKYIINCRLRNAIWGNIKIITTGNVWQFCRVEK